MARLEDIASERPAGSHLLPDPDTAPDEWTQGAVQIANEAILNGTCPSCGGTPDHEPGCSGLTETIDRYVREQGLTLSGMTEALYVKDGDGGHKKLANVKIQRGF